MCRLSQRHLKELGTEEKHSSSEILPSAVQWWNCTALQGTLLYNSAQAYRRGGGRDIPEAVARPDACLAPHCVHCTECTQAVCFVTVQPVPSQLLCLQCIDAVYCKVQLKSTALQLITYLVSTPKSKAHIIWVCATKVHSVKYKIMKNTSHICAEHKAGSISDEAASAAHSIVSADWEGRASSQEWSCKRKDINYKWDFFLLNGSYICSHFTWNLQRGILNFLCKESKALFWKFSPSSVFTFGISTHFLGYGCWPMVDRLPLPDNVLQPHVNMKLASEIHL